MTMMGTAGELWSRYLATIADRDTASARFYEAFRIGDSDASAARGAELIVSGTKTATSALLWEYEAGGRPPPAVGALSILEAGEGRPVAVIETTEVRTIAFDAVDAAFAADYGEFGGTLADWRRECWDYYSGLARRLGRESSPGMLLVCERFRVVYRG